LVLPYLLERVIELQSIERKSAADAGAAFPASVIFKFAFFCGRRAEETDE
jgi:hypothetical protein